MLEKLRRLNLDMQIYSVRNNEFVKYGKILDIDTEEIVKACLEMQLPSETNAYETSVERLENLSCSKALREMLFGV